MHQAKIVNRADDGHNF